MARRDVRWVDEDDTKEVLVEGVKVVFQIMSNPEHQKMLQGQ